jgi:Na+-transporting methylmalonyl-CoA/oxaloacetate decarboxylase gamma subunit
MPQEVWTLVVLGFGIVFAVLALIALVVAWMRRLDDSWQAREKAQDEQALAREPTIDATTLVLIAAAATTLLKGRGRIRKIRRLLPADSPRSAWSAQGRLAVQGSHIISKKQSKDRT